jgi:hypothetical protein
MWPLVAVTTEIEGQSDARHHPAYGNLQVEADIALWDGDNNDFSFIEADLNIVVSDALRVSHDINAGDCVAVEQGEHANIRRVSPQMCTSQPPQTTYPDTHVRRSSNPRIARQPSRHCSRQPPSRKPVWVTRR